MLPKEKEYIWDARWTPGKIIFLAVRYMPFLDLPLWPFADAFMPGGNLGMDCVTATYCTIITFVVAVFLADFVYGLRTWALWQRNRLLGWFLIVAGLGFNVSCVILLAVLQPGVPSQRIEGLPGCFILPSSSDEMWKAYLLTTSFQLVLLVATVVKGVQHWGARQPQNLTTVLYRDAFLSFVGQLCIGWLNVILLRVTQEPNYSLNATYRALLSVLPARIILNIREAASEGGRLDGWDITLGPGGELRTSGEEIALGSVRQATAVTVVEESWKEEG